MLRILFFLLAGACGSADAPEGLAPPHRIGSVLEGLSPDVLLLKEGKPGKVELTHQPVWELYPRVCISGAWEIEAGYQQQRLVEYLEWKAVPVYPYSDGKSFIAKRIPGGMLVLGAISTAREATVMQWSFRPRLRGFEQGMASPAAWRVKWRGRSGPEFEQVVEMVFDRGGRHMGYQARRGAEWWIVVDGKPYGPYEAADRLSFSRRGDGWAFCARKGSEWKVVTAKTSYGGYARVGRPVVSEGGHVAFRAMRGVSWTVVRDGKEGDEFDRVGRPVWRADGQRLAYTAGRLGEAFCVVDGQVFGGWEDVKEPLFDDGGSVAWIGRRGGREYMVRGGEPVGKGFDELSFLQPAGVRLVARGRRGVEWYVVVDGKPGPAFASVGEPLVGPKGRHIAYTATHDLKTAVVVDGRILAGGFDWAGRLDFGIRGRRLGFAAMKDGNTDWMVFRIE